MHGHSIEPPNAVQWDNVFMQNYLRKVCIERGVKLIKDNVVSADLDEKGYVKHLITKDNGNIEGDIFIDCTGFSAILLDKIYDVQWHSIEHMLPNNNAVVVRKKYTNPQQECHPYTNAKAMNAGWRWTIPTYHDISYGYVYSDKYIDKDDAEKELRESINEWDTSALHVPFKAGIRSTIAHKNVIAAGLSAGFVEPLEATSLAFTCTIIGDLNRILFETGDVWEEKWEGFLNKKFNAVFTEIANFIFMHFYASTKNDTEYWRDRHLVEIPENCKNVYNAFKDAPMDPESFQKLMMAKVPLFKFLTPPAPMFSAGHWFQLLYSYGWYQNVNPDISKDALKIANRNRINYQLNISMKEFDIMKCNLFKKWDVIVSNPPYVLESEKEYMDPNIFYEPDISLFVNDNNPLLYYKEIANQATNCLNNKGLLYFEINEKFGSQITHILSEEGFVNIELKKDINDKERMIKAIWK